LTLTKWLVVNRKKKPRMRWRWRKSVISVNG